MAEDLYDLGERGLIERLRQRLPGGQGVVLGPGDDCAIVSIEDHGPHELLLTSDPVIEGIHFDSGEDPCRIGAKAMGRVLSDIAAMGGEPLWALVNLVLPAGADVTLAEALYDGLLSASSGAGVMIVGGDVARGAGIELHLFGVGRVPRGRAVRRSGGQVGDALFVTGPLGGSLTGKHLDFTPRVAEGLFLRDWASCMIDVTDGLLTDLRHLCAASAVGASIREAAVPVSEAARLLNDGRSPMEHAMVDGEDFELLFAVAEAKRAALVAAWPQNFDSPLFELGRFTEGAASIRVLDEAGHERKAMGQGFDHFGKT